MKQFGFLKVAGIILLVIICGVIIASFVSYGKEQNARISENENTIKELTSQLNGLSNDSTETVEDVQLKLTSAADAGTKVASLQNLYLDADEAECTELAKNMDIYLASDSANARVAWYAYDISDVSYTWSFESTYTFDSDSIPVVWTCRTDDNVLLAYATAVYDAKSERFGTLEYHMTTKGASLIPAD